jgi:ER lumen protein retaining receptor
MLNDYRPTHDPNLDTFKVQYLLGASAVLALVFPYYYTFPEVRTQHEIFDMWGS